VSSNLGYMIPLSLMCRTSYSLIYLSMASAEVLTQSLTGRTIETSQYLYEHGYSVRQRSQMSQLNPGVCEKKSEKRIRLEYPEEVVKHEADPYHHRYPRAEVGLQAFFPLSCQIVGEIWYWRG
jgi:broad specificity phosphatase PhoE